MEPCKNLAFLIDNVFLYDFDMKQLKIDMNRIYLYIFLWKFETNKYQLDINNYGHFEIL